MNYDDLGKVAEDLLGLEKDSQEKPLTFADYHNLDLRISPYFGAAKCYPQGSVPLVRLGTSGY